MTKSEIRVLRSQTADLGDGGAAHAAPENLEDLVEDSGQATDRIIEALGLVDPSTDWVDGMTYTRIVKGADLENLRKSSLAENDFGFTGFTASLLSPQNDL